MANNKAFTNVTKFGKKPAYRYVRPADNLPDIGSTSNDSDPLLRVKLFNPTGSWTWYLSEFDGVDKAFGFVKGFDGELGYISLKELAAVRGKFDLPIERDIHWKPRKLSEIA